MLVRNWMQANPITVPGSMLVSEAKRILSENKLHALPVVEQSRLRGLVTRANLLRMGQFVLHSHDPDEFNYFVNRVRVRDIMLRKPATVQASDSMDQCLRKGQELGVSQFPVLEGDELVGVISANEVFQIAADSLGAWEHRNGITVGPLRLGPGVIANVTRLVESAGAVTHAVYPVSARHDGPRIDHGELHRLIIRFNGGSMRELTAALEAAGYPVLESVDRASSAAAARCSRQTQIEGDFI